MDERAHEPLSKEVLDDWLKVILTAAWVLLLKHLGVVWGIEEVREGTGNITRWFLHRFKKIADVEAEIVTTNCDANHVTEAQMRKWKGLGFTDAHIADALSGFPATGWNRLPEGRTEIDVAEATP